MDIRNQSFFEDLATEMNAHPERFTTLGEADMVAALVMRDDDAAFVVELTFAGLGCEAVRQIDERTAHDADFRLDGALDAWRAMFDDIALHGTATGRMTINSLALLGDDIICVGDDPMGEDKFSRFNQTLQEYFDGASRLAAVAG
ncbi:MAG: hypothetical protein R2705_11745 [Ilumatobacteraceae bacterium]